MSREIDAHISVKDGELFIEDCRASDLAKEFSTPCFVVSETQLRHNVRRFQKAFEKHWTGKEVQLLPAIKANWIQGVRNILSEEGTGCDVFSDGEFEIALASGADPKKVSVNGGGKSEELIGRVIDAGARLTIDDTDELGIIQRVAAKKQKKAYVRFRLRPNMKGAWQISEFSLPVASVDLSSQIYKSGIPTEHLWQLGKDALKDPNIVVTGFHLHMGRHHSSVTVWKTYMREYARLIVQLRDAWDGYLPEEIDIGGGFAAPRDPFFKMINRWDIPLTAVFWLVLPLACVFGHDFRYRVTNFFLGLHDLFNRKAVLKNQAPTIEEYAESTVSTLQDELNRAGIDHSKMVLQLEPGRSLHSNIGIHLSKVLKVKTQTKPIEWNWVLLDTSYFFLAGGVFEFNNHDFLVANRAEDERVWKADIVGRSCYADRILPEVWLPKVSSGDLLAIFDTGAYQEVSASNFNALPRPGTLLVSKDQAAWIRRPETDEDVRARDVLPPHLTKSLNLPPDTTR